MKNSGNSPTIGELPLFYEKSIVLENSSITISQLTTPVGIFDAVAYVDLTFLWSIKIGIKKDLLQDLL